MTTQIPTFPHNDFAQNVFGRRSIRRFKPDVTIPRDEMIQILAEAGRAPSSMNLQPWRFVVVESAEGKAKLHDQVMTNTPQVETASALVIVFALAHPEHNAQEIYDAAVAQGSMDQATHDRELTEIEGFYGHAGEVPRTKIIGFDSGLVTMQLALVARARGYDTCIIGGFEGPKVQAAFAPGEGLIPQIIVAMGKADETGYPTVRLPIDEITTFA